MPVIWGIIISLGDFMPAAQKTPKWSTSGKEMKNFDQMQNKYKK